MAYRFFVSALLAIFSVYSLGAQSTDGDWSETLKLGAGRELRLVLHISVAQSSITMDSPDQNAYDLKCDVNFLSADSVSLSIPSLMMSYQGKLKADTLYGTFQQGGIKLPLDFQRGIEKRNRPQTPKAPFPYRTENVKINNEAAGVTLSGTLSIPQNFTDETPIVVFASGSGPSNRDEELFDHKPFAVIADYLARNGVASLRYDDRGVGESTGNISEATTADLATDTKAVIDWIRAQKRFGKTGIVGHSEGGIIAYMLGASENGPDFIVSIAGPSVTGAEILDFQNKNAFMKNGMAEKQAEEYAIIARQRLEADPSMKWMHYFLKHNPAEDLKNLKIPAFIIYGEKDMQVPPSLNLEPAKCLATAATVKCYSGLNHLMQHAVSGGVEEYGIIEETFAPELLADIAIFIKSLAAGQ